MVDWDALAQTTLAVICSTVGVSFVLKGLFTASMESLSNRLTQNHQAALDKMLATHQSKLDGKNYVSKVRFDKEFKVNADLSAVFFELVSNVYTLIPPRIACVPSDEQERQEYEEQTYKRTVDSRNECLEVLRKNAIFISKSTCDKYYEILKLCDKQIRAFGKRYSASYLASKARKKELDFADYERSEEIHLMLDGLNDELREYLQNLEVID